VERDSGPLVEGAASFHTTRWTIVMSAVQSQAPGGQSALAQLCRTYWYPLYMFARRREYSQKDAQDSTQGFFLRLLEHRALAGVGRLNGKFRPFLLASFQNHLSDQLDRARRLKRGGDKEFVWLDAEEAERAVKTLIHRLRKRYSTLLREEVSRTVSDSAEIDEEIHALCEALIASEGRLGP
jgi:DNA-directed RNA polymerase specialized sigma24 family protein